MKKQSEYTKDWRHRHPENYRAQVQRNLAPSQAVATNAYEPWTAEQIKIANEWTGTDRELGLLIGRSIRGVQTARTRGVINKREWPRAR